MRLRSKKIIILRNYIILLICLGLIFLPFYSKGQPEIQINHLHHPIWDIFFSWITHLGDGLILILPLVFLLFYKYCYFLLFFLASIFHLGLVQLGKNWVFQGMPRPVEFLKDISFYKVPGVTLHHWGSFPSGHTATAFMLASFLFLVLPKKFKIHVLLIGTACLVGFSRVYLMQHFLVDIWAGALIGIFSTSIAYLIVQKAFAKRKYHQPIIQKQIPFFKSIP
jgi:membrane-associated phospholipid phosphatase